MFCRECINRVCESAGLKTVDKKRRIDKKVQGAIAEIPRMDYAGTNVSLNVSSSSLTLRSLDSGQIIASHDMPRISFASGGDCVSITVYVNTHKIYLLEIETWTPKMQPLTNTVDYTKTKT